MTERVAGIPILHPLMSSPDHYRDALRLGKHGWLALWSRATRRMTVHRANVVAGLAVSLPQLLGSPDEFVDRHLVPASASHLLSNIGRLAGVARISGLASSGVLVELQSPTKSAAGFEPAPSAWSPRRCTVRRLVASRTPLQMTYPLVYAPPPRNSN